MIVVLYQPDIPQNTGTILRLAACLGISVHIIEPAGFTWSEKSLKRAGLDYLDHAKITRHDSFSRFTTDRPAGRLVLATTRRAQPYTEFAYRPDDLLLLGRESSGVPENVHDLVEAAVTVPMQRELRSLNVAVACAMILGEGLRQTGGFPAPSP